MRPHEARINGQSRPGSTTDVGMYQRSKFLFRHAVLLARLLKLFQSDDQTCLKKFTRADGIDRAATMAAVPSTDRHLHAKSLVPDSGRLASAR